MVCEGEGMMCKGDGVVFEFDRMVCEDEGMVCKGDVMGVIVMGKCVRNGV